MSASHYLEAWLRGIGCVPLYNLMEDAATAEISRTQVWQWLKHGAQARRRPPRSTAPSCAGSSRKSCEKTKAMVGAARFKGGKYHEAAKLFRDLSEARDFSDFLTLPAYDMIVSEERKAAA